MANAEKIKVLHLEPQCYGLASRCLLEEYVAVDYHHCQRQEQLLSLLKAQEYQAIFIRIGIEITAATLASAPGLKWLVTPTTGVTHIKLPEDHGVEIISLQGEDQLLGAVTSTAEHCWALLLTLVRKIPQATSVCHAGQWARESLLATELYGKTIGILGYGRLGKMVGRYASSFGMRVIAHDIRKPEKTGNVYMVSKQELIKSADIISLHLSYEESNRHYISGPDFKQMKQGVLLINTARGELIDEGALLENLRTGHLSGVALDVLNNDSAWDGVIPDSHPLSEYSKDHDNLIITPHMGGYAKDAIAATRHFIVQKFINALSARTRRHE